MMKILSEKPDLFEKRLPDVRGSYGQRSKKPRVVIIDLHRERGLAFLVAEFFRPRFNEAIISSAVLNGPAVLPRFTSSRAFLRRASMIRRCSGVYSSSAVGNLGRMVMT